MTNLPTRREFIGTVASVAVVATLPVTALAALPVQPALPDGSWWMIPFTLHETPMDVCSIGRDCRVLVRVESGMPEYREVCNCLSLAVAGRSPRVSGIRVTKDPIAGCGGQPPDIWYQEANVVMDCAAPNDEIRILKCDLCIYRGEGDRIIKRIRCDKERT